MTIDGDNYVKGRHLIHCSLNELKVIEVALDAYFDEVASLDMHTPEDRRDLAETMSAMITYYMHGKEI